MTSAGTAGWARSDLILFSARDGTLPTRWGCSVKYSPYALTTSCLVPCLHTGTGCATATSAAAGYHGLPRRLSTGFCPGRGPLAACVSVLEALAPATGLSHVVRELRLVELLEKRSLWTWVLVINGAWRWVPQKGTMTEQKNINYSCAEDIHTWDGFLQHLVCVWCNWPFFLVAGRVTRCIRRGLVRPCCLWFLCGCAVCPMSSVRHRVRHVRSPPGVARHACVFFDKKGAPFTVRMLLTWPRAACDRSTVVQRMKASSAVVSWQSLNAESPSIGRA